MRMMGQVERLKSEQLHICDLLSGLLNEQTEMMNMANTSRGHVEQILEEMDSYNFPSPYNRARIMETNVNAYNRIFDSLREVDRIYQVNCRSLHKPMIYTKSGEEHDR